jgi:hypothetical protein
MEAKPTMADFATVADALSSCTGRVTADTCSKLFAATTPPVGDAPKDTLAAAETIAHYPWYQPTRLFAQLAEFYPISPGNHMRTVLFMPNLSFPPSAWVLGLSSTAVDIAPVAKPCSTTGATFGSVTTSRSVGRARTSYGRATPPSSTPTVISCARLPLAFQGRNGRRNVGCIGRRQVERLVEQVWRQIYRGVQQYRQTADASGRHQLWRKTRTYAGNHRYPERRCLGVEVIQEPSSLFSPRAIPTRARSSARVLK